MALNAAVRDSHAAFPQHLGIVSQQVPLLSNLTAAENIALIRQYHCGLSAARAMQLARTYLSRAGADPLAEIYVDRLDHEQRLAVKFLRAVMFPDAVVAVVKPSQQLPDEADCVILRDLIDIFEDSYRECRIFELSRHAAKFKGLNG